jgi:hypothetical protein
VATHDYVISNGTGSAVRSDINGALAAIVSQNSNASEPATMYAYQWWADTTTGLLKIRNAANSAWVTIGTLASANLGLLPLAGGTMTGVLAVTAGTAALPGIAVSGDPNTGIYSPGADQVAISTGGTGRLFVDASGSVGLGTSQNPTTGGFARPVIFLKQFSDPNTGFAGIHIEASGDQSVLGIGYNGTTNAFEFDTSFRATGARRAIVFKTTGAECARIDTSGRLLVGTIASPAHQLQVSTDSTGKPSTSTWTIVSDERIKEDIELADLDLCYEAIKAIPLKRYKWRDEIYTAEQVTDRRKLGWIAQDVEAVFPKAVGMHEFKYNQVFEETIIPAVEEELDADGNVITPAQPERTEQGDLISEDVIEDCRNLNSDQIYAAMYGAVQKLMAKVETLEASNADLLARVAALEAA